ncbi:hypothetical protein [Myroides sp.]|uniref:hypothetical protein n=1 Tax=Myroides sp. TaxID=1874736 RepID=UPI003F3D477A
MLEYAVMCASSFITYPLIEELVILLLLDNTRYSNLRHCALSAIEKIENKEKRKRILEQLIDDPEFTKYAQRLLEKIASD